MLLHKAARHEPPRGAPMSPSRSEAALSYPSSEGGPLAEKDPHRLVILSAAEAMDRFYR